jgi:hypothetical protein
MGASATTIAGHWEGREPCLLSASARLLELALSMRELLLGSLRLNAERIKLLLDLIHGPVKSARAARMMQRVSGAGERKAQTGDEQRGREDEEWV